MPNEKKNSEKENSEEETLTNEEETSQETESQEASQQTLEEAQAELERTKAQLGKVNSESAKRRIRIKELEVEKKEREAEEMDDLEKAQTSAKDLEKQNQEYAARLRTHDLRRAFASVAEEMEIQFSSSQAVDDAFTIAQPLLKDIEVEDDGSVNSKELKSVIKDVLKGRDYLTSKKTKSPDIDAEKRGTESLEAPEKEQMEKKREHVDYKSL